MSSLRLTMPILLMVLIAIRANGAEVMPSGQSVSVEVVIAEFSSTEKAELTLGLGSSDKSIAERLKQLTAQGQVGVITQTRLTTLHQQEASVQIGETVPAVSGRTGRGGPAGGFGAAGGGGGGGSGGGFPTSTTYTMVSTGTIIRATPTCEEGGAVLVNLKIERTRLVPKPKAEGAADVEPARTATVTANSTVRVPAGQTVLVSGARNVSNDQATELLIFVSAQVGTGK